MTTEKVQPEPKIVIAKAIPQEKTTFTTPNASTPLYAPQATDELGFDILCCGDDTRSGIRVRPGTNFVIKLCGNTNIKLPEDPPLGAHYKFIIMNLCGDAKFLISKGAKIVLRRASLCGNRTIETDEKSNNISNAITVKVTIVQLCGDVRITSYQ